MEKTLLIGLTGKYCAGKNYVAQLLEEHSLPVLDVDKLGHRVLEQEKDRVAGRFGRDILDAEGHINRRLLGERVFGQKDELKALEDLIHPGVNRETQEWVQVQKTRACVINAALLHRSSVFSSLSAIILVEAGLITRMVRAKKRDKLPYSALMHRFKSQEDFTPQYFIGKSDIYRVENSGFIGPGHQSRQRKLRIRIEEILSLLGLCRV